jgi:hypothetical protein
MEFLRDLVAVGTQGLGVQIQDRFSNPLTFRGSDPSRTICAPSIGTRIAGIKCRPEETYAASFPLSLATC